MNDEIVWHDETDLLGVRVRAWFFTADEVTALTDPVVQLLPMLAEVPPVPVVPLGQRSQHVVGGLQAQPDAVLRHGDGLICLMYKATDQRPLDRPSWRQQLRVDTMLQTIAQAMAVAGQQRLPTAALWRGPNLVCQFDPGSAVLECLATHIGAARHYWNEPGLVSPAQLASFCEPRLRALPGLAQSGDTLPG